MAKPMPSLPLPADDRRVDPDHLAVHVDQRAARVAPVDRRVGLDERLIARQAAAIHVDPQGVPLERRDDARGDTLAQLERGADRHDQLADLEPGAVALGQGLVAGVVDLDHGDVGGLVRAHDLRVRLGAVVEGHLDLLGVLHHVVVREDMAAVVVDEA
jgi:hypothetical protein